MLDSSIYYQIRVEYFQSSQEVQISLRYFFHSSFFLSSFFSSLWRRLINSPTIRWEAPSLGITSTFVPLDSLFHFVPCDCFAGFTGTFCSRSELLFASSGNLKSRFANWNHPSLDINNCLQADCGTGICVDYIDEHLCFCRDGSTGFSCNCLPFKFLDSILLKSQVFLTTTILNSDWQRQSCRWAPGKILSFGGSHSLLIDLLFT